MPAWTTRLGFIRDALLISARTTVAADVSQLVARSLKLAEFYWAPISTFVILLFTINPLTLAWQRFARTTPTTQILPPTLSPFLPSHY